MFIGHFAPAFVAAALSPRSPRLATLFVAAQLADWAFFALVLVGVERLRVEPGATAMVPLDLYHMPYTHSLLGMGAWALVCALVVGLWQRGAFAGLLAGVVVLSHWVLDWVTHRPDLTFDGSPPYYGLGLWNSPMLAMPLELLLVLTAFSYYVRRTRGPLGPPAVLLGAMLVLQAVNWFAPHPAEAGPLLILQALGAFAALTVMAAWVGENRWFQKRGGLAFGDG